MRSNDAARLELASVRGSKALLILTDGFHTGSAHSRRQAADEAHKTEATVYARRSKVWMVCSPGAFASARGGSNLIELKLPALEGLDGVQFCAILATGIRLGE